MALITSSGPKTTGSVGTGDETEATTNRTTYDEVDASIDALFKDSVDASEIEETIDTSNRGGSLRDRMARVTGMRRKARAAKEKTTAGAGETSGGSTAVGAEAGSEDEETPATELKGLRGWRARRARERELTGAFENYPHLLAIKPKEGYVFHSDYYKVDDSFACVLAFFHREAADDGFASFWGVDRVPDGLHHDVTAVVFEQTRRMDESWVKQHEKMAERLDVLDAKEQADAGTRSSKQKTSKVAQDMEVIASELRNGATYLHVHNRIMLKAPTLEILEESLERLSQLYTERFATITTAAYTGLQRNELGGLLKPNDKKRGRGFHFTSTELAGSYSLVTNGINDKAGEFVGEMVGDLNNSAVLFEVDGFDHHTVIADEAMSLYLERQRVSNMWCSKISQAALLNNHRVVHLVLDGADLDKLGPKFSRLTSRVDMSTGDVNMFEMFGDKEEELAIFSVQMEKLKLMYEQLHEDTDGSVRTIIRGALEESLTDFYVDQGMWRYNAQENRHKLRVVGIPHQDVPRLEMFISYLNVARKRLMAASDNDPDQLRAYNVLISISNMMLNSNGELFNKPTTTAIDGVNDAQRVIYEFSKLIRRGKGLAMAQFVNVLGFAVSTLGEGDVVIIHGAEHIDDGVKKYVGDQLAHLYSRGGRVVYSYNDVGKMLDDQDFNTFDAADYTVLGPMREPIVEKYQKLLHQVLPPDLHNLVVRRGEGLTFLRRGKQNIVFHTDLALGINPHREADRRKLARQAQEAMEKARAEAALDQHMEPGARRSSVMNESMADPTYVAARERQAAVRAARRKSLLRKDEKAAAAVAQDSSRQKNQPGQSSGRGLGVNRADKARQGSSSQPATTSAARSAASHGSTVN